MSSHISFFCSKGPFLWSSMTAREHTRWAGRSAWETSGSFPLSWKTRGSLPFARETSGSHPFAWEISWSLPSFVRPAYLSPSLERIVDLFLQSKITDLMLSFQVLCGYMNILFSHVFFCLWLVIGTYILPFFPVICWSYLQTEISVTLSIGNKLYSCHLSLYFSLL